MYVEKKYPDRYLGPRTGRTLEGQQANCKKLLEYCTIGMPWHDQPWDSLIPGSWDVVMTGGWNKSMEKRMRRMM